MMIINIAIDGPAGAGKSTIAKKVAKELQYVYVDTGAMYRAIGYEAYSVVFKDKVFIINEETQREINTFLAERLSKMTLSIFYINDEQNITVDNENVTAHIRGQEIGTMASIVSANKEVRLFLVKEQQRMATEKSVVMDGRDIGTFVLPDAPLKIYLTASSCVRAKRRYNQLLEKGENPNFDELKAEIEERDARDMNRDFAPLKEAEDAVRIDSSQMTIKEVVDKICGLARAIDIK